MWLHELRPALSKLLYESRPVLFYFVKFESDFEKNNPPIIINRVAISSNEKIQVSKLVKKIQTVDSRIQNKFVYNKYFF